MTPLGVLVSYKARRMWNGPLSTKTPESAKTILANSALCGSTPLNAAEEPAEEKSKDRVVAVAVKQPVHVKDPRPPEIKNGNVPVWVKDQLKTSLAEICPIFAFVTIVPVNVDDGYPGSGVNDRL
jgi:hypothetical protein